MLRESTFQAEDLDLANANFVNFYQVAANVTFQGLMIRDTTLYDATSLVNYYSTTGYSDRPTEFTLDDIKVENVSHQGNTPQPIFTGVLFYVIGSSLFRVHRLYLSDVYTQCKNTCISICLILDRCFNGVLLSELYLFCISCCHRHHTNSK